MYGIKDVLGNKNEVLVKSKGPLFKFIHKFLYFYHK